jgi:hypothetical protein
MRHARLHLVLMAFALAFLQVSCDDDDDAFKVHDVNKAEKASIDRFSADAGHLQVRTASNGIPGPNVAVNFDQGVFITKGIGPNGELFEYYNFDIQPVLPAPIYVLIRLGETDPVTGQLNIVNVIPGDNHYNDFWQVIQVSVPATYEANEVASYDEIIRRGYTMTPTNSIVNCPIVPEGSVASKRLTNESPGLVKGWYKDKVVFYFNFSEKSLTTTASGNVPLSPILVSFNENGNPGSGFVTEAGNNQTHNVVATVPSQPEYSPLWSVSAYDNADFNSVTNLATAAQATVIASGIANVNCPIVKIN